MVLPLPVCVLVRFRKASTKEMPMAAPALAAGAVARKRAAAAAKVALKAKRRASDGVCMMKVVRLRVIRGASASKAERQTRLWRGLYGFRGTVGRAAMINPVSAILLRRSFTDSPRHSE